jgi:hypothetical protein
MENGLLRNFNFFHYLKKTKIKKTINTGVLYIDKLQWEIFQIRGLEE